MPSLENNSITQTGNIINGGNVNFSSNLILWQFMTQILCDIKICRRLGSHIYAVNLKKCWSCDDQKVKYKSTVSIWAKIEPAMEWSN